MQRRVAGSRRKVETQAPVAEATPSAAVAKPDHWVPMERERAVKAGAIHRWRWSGAGAEGHMVSWG